MRCQPTDAGLVRKFIGDAETLKKMETDSTVGAIVDDCVPLG